jgi:hypothetical protein
VEIGDPPEAGLRIQGEDVRQATETREQAMESADWRERELVQGERVFVFKKEKFNVIMPRQNVRIWV